MGQEPSYTAGHGVRVRETLYRNRERQKLDSITFKKSLLKNKLS